MAACRESSGMLARCCYITINYFPSAVTADSAGYDCVCLGKLFFSTLLEFHVEFFFSLGFMDFSV